MKTKGVIAAGHPETAKAAETILRGGGNAFDAVVAAHLAACVVEPVLSSLGGGGFLLSHTKDEKQILYDFFVQTPKQKIRMGDTAFFPISADFGSVQQEFHIGPGSIATPGTVKGLFTVHEELCSMPMQQLVEPAVNLARNGVIMNEFQAYIFEIVHPIYDGDAATRKNYNPHKKGTSLLREGQTLLQPELADTLENLAIEGEKSFYHGEIAHAVHELCAEKGGHLSTSDFADYQVVKRVPLSVSYRQATLLTNPPPSSGGTLIAFALKMLESIDLQHYCFGSTGYLDLLANIIELTNKARIDACLDHTIKDNILDPDFLADYRELVRGRAQCSRGTTHISIMDQSGNIASLTTSNGEGCGLLIPGTGIMLNNMLGEEDLNPNGFHQWTPDQRMTSMMAPSIVLLPDSGRIALGSGGSNRLRTAILQVLVNLIDFQMPLDQAVTSPRIHFESGVLNVEGGFNPDQLKPLMERHPNHKLWNDRNLYFGGTHTASKEVNGFTGTGDPRRGGVAITIS